MTSLLILTFLIFIFGTTIINLLLFFLHKHIDNKYIIIFMPFGFSIFKYNNLKIITDDVIKKCSSNFKSEYDFLNNLEKIKNVVAIVLVIILLYYPYEYFRDINLSTDIISIEKRLSEENKAIQKGIKKGTTKKVPTAWGYGYIYTNEEVERLIKIKDEILFKYIPPLVTLIYFLFLQSNIKGFKFYYDLRKEHLIK